MTLLGGTLECIERGLEPLLLVLGQTQVEIVRAAARIVFQVFDHLTRRGEFLDRLVSLPGGKQKIAQVVVYAGFERCISGLLAQGEGFFEQGLGLVILLLIGEYDGLKSKLAAFQSLPGNRALLVHPGAFIDELLGDVQDGSCFGGLLRGDVLVRFLQQTLEGIRDPCGRLSSHADRLADLSL